MKKIEKSDFIKFKSKYSSLIEYAMILDIYDIKDGSKGIHHCTPRKQEHINSLMNQSYNPIDHIEWYIHFDSLEDIFRDMKDTGYIK